MAATPGSGFTSIVSVGSSKILRRRRAASNGLSCARQHVIIRSYDLNSITCHVVKQLCVTDTSGVSREGMSLSLRAPPVVYRSFQVGLRKQFTSLHASPQCIERWPYTQNMCCSVEFDSGMGETRQHGCLAGDEMRRASTACVCGWVVKEGESGVMEESAGANGILSSPDVFHL